MARMTINSHEDIITAGERLEAQSGATVEAWEVFKDLGSRGKFDRVRDIWDGHTAARSAAPTATVGDLPADVEAALDTALSTLGVAIRRQFSDHVAGLIADHVRQMQLAHTQYAGGLAKQSAQTDYWRDVALERQEQIERLEGELEKAPETKTVRKAPTKRKMATAAGGSSGKTDAVKKINAKQPQPPQPAIDPAEQKDQPPPCPEK